MPVFKTYMKLLWRTLPTVMIYIFLFSGLLVIMSKILVDNDGYSDVSISISVYDEDNSEVSKTFYEFLDNKYDIVSVPQNEELILDGLFNAVIDYAVVINDGFQEKLSAGETEGLFKSYHDAKGAAGVIVDSAIDEYIKSVCTYQIAGLELNEALESANATLLEEVSVTKETFSESASGGLSKIHSLFFQYFSYIIISVFMSSACPVLLKMNNSNIKKRVNSSCISQSSQTLQLMLGSAVVFIGIWVLLNIIGVFISGESFGKMHILAILNSFVFTLVAAGISILCTAFIKEQRVVNIVSNILSLGMCFLCGAFVPQSMLGDKVLAAAHLLPVYWYIRTNDMLSGLSGEIYSSSSYLLYIGIQLLFAVFFFITFILISRMKYKEENQ